MKRFINIPARGWALLALALVAGIAQAFGFEIHPEAAAGIAGALFLTGEIDGSKVMAALDRVEVKMTEMSNKATEDIKNLGKVSQDTKTAIDNLGTEQRVLADRLLQVEQKSTAQADTVVAGETWGQMFVKSAQFDNFLKADGRMKVRAEVKNTVTNPIANTYSERRPSLIEGAFRVFTLEDLMAKMPTQADAIAWVREKVFTNAAAETAETVQRPQSSITFEPGTMPVSAIGHWIKISRQLAMDNTAMVAYINRRMVYGVDLRAENQIIAGDGVGTNIHGLTKVGNYTPHGYTKVSIEALGLANNKFDLIGKMIGDCAAAGNPADVVVLNTADWWTIRLAKNANGDYLLGKPGDNVVPMLFGVPVVASAAMPFGKVWVGPIQMAVTLWYREGVAIDLSDSDGDNFTSGLVTIRAERRLAVTVEKPADCRYGDLVLA
jgi:HK97 family phage major capsid protein